MRLLLVLHYCNYSILFLKLEPQFSGNNLFETHFKADLFLNLEINQSENMNTLLFNKNLKNDKKQKVKIFKYGRNTRNWRVSIRWEMPF